MVVALARIMRRGVKSFILAGRLLCLSFCRLCCGSGVDEVVWWEEVGRGC